MTFVNGELQDGSRPGFMGLDPQHRLIMPLDVGKSIAPVAAHHCGEIIVARSSSR